MEPVFTSAGRPGPGGVTWAWLAADLDPATVPAARAELDVLLPGTGDPGLVLVHLGAECFVGLHGLALLLETAAAVRARGGVLLLVAPPACLRLMVRMFDLSDTLPLVATARHVAPWARAQRPVPGAPGLIGVC